MRRAILKGDVRLDDSRLLAIGFNEMADPGHSVLGFVYEPDFNVGRALAKLRADPALAALFLYRTSGDGSVWWEGDMSRSTAAGGSVGVRVDVSGGSMEAVGDNRFGDFLADVRRAFREELRQSGPAEVDTPSRVVSDFLPAGAGESLITGRESAGDRIYIHTDAWRSASFRFDSSLNGTTGHNRRDSDSDVDFHTFVCPFGVSSPSPIIVGSAAEASWLYEKALRDELDWDALFSDLGNRGLLARSMTGRRAEDSARFYKAQFDWMREMICTGGVSSSAPVVASSLMVPDNSFGRSVYDPVLAPSPAHVLQRYIDNPLLLFTPSVNGVERALSVEDKEEPEVLRVKGLQEGDVFRILVDGSDTIGGREPGRRASSVREAVSSTDGEGHRVLTSTVRHVVPTKDVASVEADYAAFSANMDRVLSAVPEGVRIELVSGNASAASDTVGIGTPRMVARYVREKGGKVGEWDFRAGVSRGVKGRDGKEVEPSDGGRLSAVLMGHFTECYPVMTGAVPGVSVQVDKNDPDNTVSFRRGTLDAMAAVCLSVDGDRGNRNVLALGTLAADSGLPVVHVINNALPADRAAALRSGAVMSLSRITGEVVIGDPLFRGDDQRVSWDTDMSANVLSVVDPVSGYAVPFVANAYPAAVSVGGVSFHSALGAYVALAARESGQGSPDILASIAAAEGSLRDLAVLHDRFDAGLDDRSRERMLRQSVRLMAAADASFARRLMDLDDRDVVMLSSVPYGGLFADQDGNGLNRFGIVLGVEAAALRAAAAERRLRAEEEDRKALQAAMRAQRLAEGATAPADLVRGGLPAGSDGIGKDVWLFGAREPGTLALPDGRHSFEMWDEIGGADRLTRDKASAPTVDDGEGGRDPNTFVFLFPSNLRQVTDGLRPGARPKADSVNLTGLTRIDPNTGERFECAFGIPVKRNGFSYEVTDLDGPCSYRLDNDSSALMAGVILADSKARSVAIERGMDLCEVGRVRPDGLSHWTMGQVFMEKIYDRVSRKWVDNPHRSDACLDVIRKHIAMLENGRSLPLNCVALPLRDYHAQSELTFVSDLMFSLRVANATAVALGSRLRIPLDKDGRVDFGPGVPEELRSVGERKVLSFIGALKEDKALDKGGPLPVLEKVSHLKAMSSMRSLSKHDGSTSDVMLRPNDLVRAFGPYDFSFIETSQIAPLHELILRDEDGVIYKLDDAKTSRGESRETIAAYLSYERNDERRFIIRSTDPSRIPAFKETLLSYVARAAAVKVETRLVPESGNTVPDRGLDGFVNVLSSNSLDYARSEYDVGRRISTFDTSRLDNDKGEEDVYAGHVDLADGFTGWVEMRWTLPDGSVSDWTPVSDPVWRERARAFADGESPRRPGIDPDLELRKDITMSMLRRSYHPTENRVVPSATALSSLMVGEAVKLAGSSFRDLSFAPAEKAAVSETMEVSPSPSPASVPAPTVGGDSGQGIRFIESEGGYGQRTDENANAEDVDFTFAFATDFNTTGERRTARAAGDSLVRIDLPVRKDGGLDMSPAAVSKAVAVIVDQLPEEYLSGESFGVNIAGNGIYTLSSSGVTQEQADLFVCKVLSGLSRKGAVISSLRSGGQSGIDEAGAAAGRALDIPVTVNAPKGWVFRGTDNKDVRDEKSFKNRFESKDYGKLRSLSVPVRKSVERKPGQSIA